MTERRSTREKFKLIYNPDGTVVDEYKWTKMLQSKSRFTPYHNSMPGNQITMALFQKSGFTAPIVIEENIGLDMVIPPVTVRQVSELVGPDRSLEVLEVSTQTGKQMKLSDWVDYFESPNNKRERILNVKSFRLILGYKVCFFRWLNHSLEIGDTNLGKMIKRPKIIRELDWIDNVWPNEIRMKEYPQVQLYCLMGVQDCYTEYWRDLT
jgi:hypothetical protein